MGEKNKGVTPSSERERVMEIRHITDLGYFNVLAAGVGGHREWKSSASSGQAYLPDHSFTSSIFRMISRPGSWVSVPVILLPDQVKSNTARVPSRAAISCVRVCVE